MNDRVNKIFLIFLFIYSIIGIYLSSVTGISHDEWHEQNTWEVNLKAILNFFVDNNGYDELISYKDRYFGIAFHLISQPIQLLSSDFVTKLNSITEDSGYLVSRHIPTFLIFSISGIFFHKICYKISNSSYFSLLSTIIYLLYPYLFGHSLMNPKDIPFLSFWLICTYFSLSTLDNYFFKNRINLYEIILLSFLTAFLLSIRIVGILILLQYLISIIILIDIKKIKLFIFLKNNFKILVYFSAFFLLFFYILNPIFWKNPFELINALKWFAKYKFGVCTLTLGECMHSLKLTPKYYFIWLFFKLPILIIFGIIIFPFVENKLFKNDRTKLYYSTLIISSLLILLIFIIKKVAIYDEIRHIMFLLPLIFICSLFNIFKFNEKIFYSLSFIFIFIFIIENIKINPYQYTWLNNFARFTNIQKNFELDYWGVSGKNLQKKIIQISDEQNFDKSNCIYGGIYNGVYLKKSNFTCFKGYSTLDDPKKKPFIAFQNTRNLKRSSPKDCSLKWVEKYNYLFFKQDLIMGKVWYCN